MADEMGSELAVLMLSATGVADNLRVEGIDAYADGVLIDFLQIRHNSIVPFAQTTVAAGADQGTATVLQQGNLLFVTGADGATGVKLGVSDDSGQTLVFLYNNSASALKVYPSTGETINGLSANAPFIQSAHSVVIYAAAMASSGAWATVPNGGTAAMTAGLTAITHTAPTPDYAIQDLTQTTPFGFVTADEGNTALSVLANCQTQIAEIKAILIGAGLVPVA